MKLGFSVLMVDPVSTMNLPLVFAMTRFRGCELGQIQV